MTDVSSAQPAAPAWREAGLRYYNYNFYLRQKFGQRVQRVSVDAKFTCPNVDGTVAKGGCVFCDNRSFSPSRRVKIREIANQINEGISKLKKRYNVERFLAYFQPATNTYAPVERLEPLYREALSHPQVVGLVVGTRPDCVGDEVLALLETIAAEHYLQVEYGLQTIHNRSLDWMNRGHHYDAFEDAMQRSVGRGFEICVHLILGLPGESREDMLASAETIAAANVQSVKLHNLYAVKNTPLADWVQSGEVTLMERDEYIETVVDVIERLPPTMVVERVSGEAPPPYLIGPSWCLDKPGIRHALQAEFERRDSYQGMRFGG